MIARIMTVMMMRVALIMMVMMMMKFDIHITIQGRCTVAPPKFNKTTL